MSSPSTNTATQNRRNRFFAWATWGIIGWSILLMIASSFLNPLYEAPDEVEHLGFIRHLRTEKGLPVQELAAPPSQSHQTPLYYLLGALIIAPIELDDAEPVKNPFWTSYWRDKIHQDNKNQFLPSAATAFPYEGTALAMHLLRLYSVVLAAATLLVGRAIGRLLWPNRPARTLIMLSFVALNPMFIYIGGSVNNDNLVNLFGALVILFSLQALEARFSWRQTLLIALCWAAAMLSKLTGLFLLVTWGSALLYAGWQRRDLRLILSRSGAILGTFLPLTGWWFLRNLTVYGEPLALTRTITVWGPRPAALQTAAAFYAESIYIWTNYWGRFGYGQVTLPSWAYWLFALLVLPAAVGLVRASIATGRRRWLEAASFSRREAIWLIMGLTLATYTGALAYYTYQNATGANGRYLYPAIFAAAALLTLGWVQLGPARWLAPIISATLFLMATYAILGLTPWTFARPDTLSVAAAQAQVNPNKTARWENGIALLGAAFEPIYHEDERGLELAATFCWQAAMPVANDVVFFVHLLDSDLNPLGQRDSFPGLGSYPPSLWQPGEAFCDRLLIPVIPSMVQDVVIADVEIGFYDPLTRERELASYQGQQLELVYIDRVRLAPAALPDRPAPAERLSAQFAGGVELLGYEWGAEPLPSVTLWWRSRGPLDHNYQVFAQLIDEAGNIIAQGDSAPQNGAYPTGLWGQDEVILDQHTLTAATTVNEAMLARATLYVGFYRLEDGTRLPRVDGGDLPDSVAIPGPR